MLVEGFLKYSLLVKYVKKNVSKIVCYYHKNFSSISVKLTEFLCFLKAEVLNTADQLCGSSDNLLTDTVDSSHYWHNFISDLV